MTPACLLLVLTLSAASDLSPPPLPTDAPADAAKPTPEATPEEAPAPTAPQASPASPPARQVPRLLTPRSRWGQPPAPETPLVGPSVRWSRPGVVLPGVAGVVLAGAAVGTLIASDAAHQELARGAPRNLTEVRALAAQGQLLRWLSLGCAGGSVLAFGTALYFFHRDAPPRLTLAPTPGGAALVLGGGLP